MPSHFPILPVLGAVVVLQCLGGVAISEVAHAAEDCESLEEFRAKYPSLSLRLDGVNARSAGVSLGMALPHMDERERTASLHLLVTAGECGTNDEAFNAASIISVTLANPYNHDWLTADQKALLSAHIRRQILHPRSIFLLPPYLKALGFVDQSPEAAAVVASVLDDQELIAEDHQLPMDVAGGLGHMGDAGVPFLIRQFQAGEDATSCALGETRSPVAFKFLMEKTKPGVPTHLRVRALQGLDCWPDPVDPQLRRTQAKTVDGVFMHAARDADPVVAAEAREILKDNPPPRRYRQPDEPE